MIRSRSLNRLRRSIGRAGHRLVDERPTGLRVIPTPSKGIMVGRQPDITLYAEYRQRFFVCRPGSEAILARTHCPFALCRRWNDLLLGELSATGRGLLAGPGAWLLTRLARHDAVLVWAVGAGYWEQSYCEAQYRQIEDELSRRIVFEPWRRHLIEGASKEAHYLSTHEEEFACVLAGYFLLSSYNFFEVYIADVSCTEVYEIHHHDRVTASIPAPDSSREALQALAANADLFTDSSGFTSQCDDDEDEDPGIRPWRRIR